MASFTASVQYDDFKGTAAADNADHTSLQEYLRNKALITAAEFVVGISLRIGENQGSRMAGVYVAAYVYDGANAFDTVKAQIAAQDPVEVRKIVLEISLEEFIVLFKRFAVILTPKGLGIDGRRFIERDK